jgi:hypothetical protein
MGIGNMFNVLGTTWVFYIVGNDMKLYLLDFTSMVESAFF